mmetsp:Transcript_21796/g.46031  ORF Transcript_21796/g.46031 Transcript_21796/m.46031 type:complete len:83 (-) Transcript_21796:468-716(-)
MSLVWNLLLECRLLEFRRSAIVTSVSWLALIGSSGSRSISVWGRGSLKDVAQYMLPSLLIGYIDGCFSPRSIHIEHFTCDFL